MDRAGNKVLDCLHHSQDFPVRLDYLQYAPLFHPQNNSGYSIPQPYGWIPWRVEEWVAPSARLICLFLSLFPTCFSANPENLNGGYYLLMTGMAKTS
jgi:hypothetical protein